MTVKEFKQYLANAEDNAEVMIVSDDLDKVAEIDHIEIEQVTISKSVYVITFPI